MLMLTMSPMAERLIGAVVMAASLVVLLVAGLRYAIDQPSLEEAIMTPLTQRYTSVYTAGAPADTLLLRHESAMKEYKKRTYCLCGWLAVVAVATVLIVASWWIVEHMRSVYAANLALETALQRDADTKWQTYCEPSNVPLCTAIANGSVPLAASAVAVCLLGDGSGNAWQGRLFQPSDHTVIDCKGVLLNKTKDAGNIAIGVALVEVCVHMPLVGWMCGDCNFASETARRASFAWRLSEWLLQRWNSSQFLWTMFGICMCFWYVLAPIWWRWHSQRATINAACTAIRYGAFAADPPRGDPSLSGVHLEGAFHESSHPKHE